MENLGKRIAIFMWDENPYDARDYYDSIEELATEIISQIYDTVYRMTIARTLKEIVEWHDNDETAREAYDLYREVVAL